MKALALITLAGLALLAVVALEHLQRKDVDACPHDCTCAPCACAECCCELCYPDDPHPPLARTPE